MNVGATLELNQQLRLLSSCEGDRLATHSAHAMRQARHRAATRAILPSEEYNPINCALESLWFILSLLEHVVSLGALFKAVRALGRFEQGHRAAKRNA